MASSVIVALRNAVTSGLAAQAALAGVQVTYAWPGDDRAQRQRVFTAKPSATQEAASLKAGRLYRNEEGTFQVLVQVEVVGGDVEDADTAAIALGLVVEEWVADNKTLPSVAGLLWQRVESWDLTNLLTNDRAVTEIAYTIRYAARLT